MVVGSRRIWLPWKVKQQMQSNLYLRSHGVYTTFKKFLCRLFIKKSLKNKLTDVHRIWSICFYGLPIVMIQYTLCDLRYKLDCICCLTFHGNHILRAISQPITIWTSVLFSKIRRNKFLWVFMVHAKGSHKKQDLRF
jgi:hypothetical protein